MKDRDEFPSPASILLPAVVSVFMKNRIFWLIAIAALVLDQWTKYYWAANVLGTAVSFANPNPSIPIWPGVFHLTYAINDGAAFSWLRGAPWLRWLSLLVSLGLMALAWFGPPLSRWEQAGYGFILSGALGNGVDRFLLGFVIDFLDFRLIRFPIFNLADMFINVGIVCLLIASFRPEGKNGHKRRGEMESRESNHLRH